MAETDLRKILAAVEGPIHITLSEELVITFGNSAADASLTKTLRLEQDGSTPRSKRKPICPPILVESFGDGLKMLAEVIDG